MKKDKMIPIFFFSLALFLISFVIGYQLMGNKLEPQISRINQEKEDTQDYSDLQILKEDIRISPNTFIEERIHHTACDHVITKVNAATEEFVNMNKDEIVDYLEENYPNKKLISFSSSKITLGITKNHLCENHYIVGEKDDLIAIFKVNENGEKVLENVLIDHPISILMEVDQQKLIEGIVVDSEDELSEVLENFIS